MSDSFRRVTIIIFMTSLKVKLRESTISKREGVIYFQLIHNRNVKLITTRFKLFSSEWDKHTSSVIIQTTNQERVNELYSIQHGIELELAEIENLISTLKKKGEYTVNDIADYHKTQALNGYLFSFMEHQIAILKIANQLKTAATYSTILKSFKEFRNQQDIHFERIDNVIMKRYEIYLKDKNVSNNSISCYMRAFRAIYNKAINSGLTMQHQPFSNVYTGIARTVKRAIDQKTILRLQSLDLKNREGLSFARDLFLFSFYTRGMSFVDMAKLRKSNIKNGLLIYRRSKTKQSLSIKLEPCIIAIIEKYRDATKMDYLLPIITKENQSYDSALRSHNKRLRVISKLLNLSTPLSSYVSRHSWATLAATKGVPIQVISEGMGHENEKTTRIYLASLDQSQLDKANALIISL